MLGEEWACADQRDEADKGQKELIAAVGRGQAGSEGVGGASESII